MTDRHAGYIVTLAEGIREDDAEDVRRALAMVRGVIDVQPVVADSRVHIGRQRADDEWRRRIRDLLIEDDR